MKRASITRYKNGVTLTEMLVAVTILVVVFTAITPVFTGARATWDSRGAHLDMIQNERVLADHLSRHLSKADHIISVSESDQSIGFVQFETEDGSEYRYEVDGDGYVVYGQPDDMVVLAGPVDQFQLTCYDSNDFTNATTEVEDIGLIRVSTVVADTEGNEEINGESFVAEIHLRSVRLPGFDYSISPGVAVKDTVNFSGTGSVIDSYCSSQGPYDSANPGSGAIVTVNAKGANCIEISQNAILRGDAYIGPGGDVTNDISVSGGAQLLGFKGILEEEISIPSFSAPTYSPFKSHAQDETYSSGTVTFVSDYYFDDLTISNSATLIVNGNLTFVVKDDLIVEDNAELRILPNSSLNLYIKDMTYFRNNAKINTFAADASLLRIYIVNNNDAVDIQDDAKVYAILQNPKGDVDIEDDSEFFGKIKAEDLDCDGGVHVDLDAEF